jgi:hypothetical protein
VLRIAFRSTHSPIPKKRSNRSVAQLFVKERHVSGEDAVAAVALLLRQLEFAAWLTLFKVLFDGYPVMPQGYSRLRLQPLMRKARSTDR